MFRLDMSIQKRFWSKVDFGSMDRCWNWLASKDSNGYGKMSIGGRADVKFYKSNRLAYLLTYGEIPEGTCVLHKCDNPSCVNPRHLFLGSHADNSRDMVLKGRHGNPMKGKKHTKESLEKMSVAMSGKNNPFYGKQHSEYSKLKISLGKRGV